eukprot:CAMPEP_0178704006 /NCGR_PEP_ID=MMETSP0699-20121125/13909_1 /TAXON_ID=265572 /ORGANISM="Extubocellulus spinifer, Strain CCMP396" /LENGTH=43 /DNA_ID= /DNA_START= /DNA_END= /DNA_ORIENTATION=
MAYMYSLLQLSRFMRLTTEEARQAAGAIAGKFIKQRFEDAANG